MVGNLRRAGIEAAIIGRLTPPGEGRWVVDRAGRRTTVADTPRDELWRMLHDHDNN
jgi:hydrogenase maturation factor